jgi:hypothetical protein
MAEILGKGVDVDIVVMIVVRETKAASKQVRILEPRVSIPRAVLMQLATSG